MIVAAKLNIKPEHKVLVVNAPKGVDLGVTRTKSDPDAVIVFTRNKAELDKHAAPMMAAAREDKIAWVAYPKAGRLDTDLNRDLLWKHLDGKGIRPVRNVAIDETWSALRFRPGEMKK
jgi:hypothetical protein